MPTLPLYDVQLRLLEGRTWRFLRYLHFRDAVARVADQVETVCVCGAGHGLAELAVALEFPHIRFTLTDIIAAGYPNYHRTMDMAWRGGVDNIDFSIWNVLQPTERRFDMVASTEMLEHVPTPEPAAANMRQAATKFVYCLVPFSDHATNMNPVKRQQAWERNEHFVFGFNREDMAQMFGAPEFVAGAYWTNGGLLLRQTLQAAEGTFIRDNAAVLMQQAQNDLRADVPTSLKQAAGIKILARPDAELIPSATFPMAYAAPATAA